MTARDTRLAPAAGDNGVSAAVMAHLRMFHLSARRTGRTETMLRAVRPGDCIATIHDMEARRLRQMLKEMGREGVEVTVLNPAENPMRRRGTQPKGAMIFDHLWVEAYWTARIAEATADFRVFQREMSKFDPPGMDGDDPARRYEPVLGIYNG